MYVFCVPCEISISRTHLFTGPPTIYSCYNYYIVFLLYDYTLLMSTHFLFPVCVVDDEDGGDDEADLSQDPDE